MVASPSGQGLVHGTNDWSRRLGISLRPWSGHSPHGLLLRGAIQTAVSVFVVVVGLRLRGADEFAAGAGELESLRAVALFLVIGAVATGLLGVARIVVGAIDLLPRATVTGTVLSLDDRQALDFLPNALQHAIFTRNPQNIDKRRPRTEVVLDTADGVRQWTVRSARARRQLRRGATVRLVVTPLAGYVARVEPTTP
ncbi:MAG TPA: hypothetical protein GXZ45_00480 [Propionibacterium sp.]|nr:hypothetical protein [Propionibacterium sp.]